MSSKPLKPLRPITDENIVLDKDYIVKKVNDKTKTTLDDIYNYTRSEKTEVQRWPKSLGMKTVTSYTFYDKMGNLTNDEENISNIDEEMYNKITLKYHKNNKWYRKDENHTTIYYYVFKCPCQTQEENLTSVQPASIKKDKTYLINSCLHRFYVELVDVQEKTYFEDLEEIGEEDEEGIYKLKSYSFKLTNNSKNKDYVKQDDDDLTLFAYETRDGTYKWKEYNIYKIFEPQVSQINESKLGNISFKPKSAKSAKSNSKTKKTSPKFLPPELANNVFSFAYKKGGRKTRKNKSRKNKK